MPLLCLAPYGQLAGLEAVADSLGLKSNAVMVVDQNTQEVLFNKNGSTVLPIASLTKLMTGLVVADAELSLDERITITEDDVDTLKGSGRGSRLAPPSHEASCCTLRSCPARTAQHMRSDARFPVAWKHSCD